MAIPWSFWTKGLIPGAGGDIVPGKRGEKPFQLLLARQTGRKLFDEVAMAFEPGAVPLLRLQRKLLPAENLGQLLQGLFGLRRASLILEQLAAYQELNDTCRI